MVPPQLTARQLLRMLSSRCLLAAHPPSRYWLCCCLILTVSFHKLLGTCTNWPVHLQADGIVDKVKVAAEHKNAEGGLLAVKALAETKHSAAEAYVVAMLPILLDKYADKVLVTHSALALADEIFGH